MISTPPNIYKSVSRWQGEQVFQPLKVACNLLKSYGWLTQKLLFIIFLVLVVALCSGGSVDTHNFRATFERGYKSFTNKLVPALPKGRYLGMRGWYLAVSRERSHFFVFSLRSQVILFSVGCSEQRVCNTRARGVEIHHGNSHAYKHLVTSQTPTATCRDAVVWYQTWHSPACAPFFPRGSVSTPLHALGE